MASDKLTELGIKKAKAGDKDKKLWDGKGLYLLLTTSGSKYWRLKYRFDKKEKVFAIGVWPEVKLKEARQKRNEAKLILKSGNDPSLVKKNQKFNQHIQHSNSFGSISNEWIEMKRKEWKEDHSNDVKRAFEIHLLPDLGHRPINEITSADLLMVLKKIENQGKYETAKRARQKCEAIFRYASLSQRCDTNPASNLKGTLVSNKPKNLKYLNPKDLPKFLEKLNEYKGSILIKYSLKLVLLTLARTSEIRFSTWEEFNLDTEEPLWRIPKERMKMEREHLVPLSRQAVAIMREVKRFSHGEEYIFHQLYNPKKPMSENAMLSALETMGYGSKITVHGFRSTISTLLNERGHNPDVIERLLAHQEGNKVRAAYNRAEYLQQRRDTLQWLANYLDSLNDSTNQERLLEEEEKLKMWKRGNLY